MRKGFATAIWAAIGAAGMATSVAAEPSIRDLDRLIGTWTFEDVSTEAAGFSYREAGTRVCAYALDGEYIRCESHGKSGAKERTYVFYFNYNGLEKRFEMLAMHPNYPRKTLYAVVLSEDGSRIDLTTDPNPRDDNRSRSWATITFPSPTRMIWETRLNKTGDLPDHWPVMFRDTATKNE